MDHSYIFDSRNISSSDRARLLQTLVVNIYKDWRHWIETSTEKLTSLQFNAFSRKYESIGFQNFVVTYWPSSWLRPWSLRGDVSWNWISNASRTLRSNFLFSTFSNLVSSHRKPSLQDFPWFDIPEESHFLFPLSAFVSSS